jgi:hypothetical protein
VYDFQTDPEHCGSCNNVCDTGVECIAGVCVTAPCVGISCGSVKAMTFDSSGYRADNIGVADVCYENTAYPQAVLPKKPGIVSWEFIIGRKLEVNGVQVPVNNGDPGFWLTMPLRAGGYCIHATAGDHDYAGIKLPLPSNVP